MDPRTRLSELKHQWRPPAELRRLRPREIRLTGAGRALLSIAVLMLLGAPIIGALLHVRSTRDHDRRRDLLARGVGAQAQITRRWVSQGEHPQHMVEYSYTVAGRTWQGRVKVSKDRWRGLAPGAALAIRFLPSDPSLHLVPGHEKALIPLWLAYPVAFLMAAAGWLLTRPLAWQRRLLSEGRPAPGIVLDHRKTQHATVADYAFATMSGAMARGKVERHKDPPAVGSTLCVLYEPDQVRHNRAYPLELVRVSRRPRGRDSRSAADYEARRAESA